MYSEGCTKNSIECCVLGRLKVAVSVLRGLRAGYTKHCRALLRVVYTKGCIECILKAVLRIVVCIVKVVLRIV